MKVDFTSGEKRGLIALLVILTTILGLSVGMRMCDHRSSISSAPSNLQSDISETDSQYIRPDTTAIIFNSSHKNKRSRKRSGTVRPTKPDGNQRSFLDEPVEQ